MMASADVVTFLAADATSSPMLEPVTGETVIIPEGFYFVQPSDRKPAVLTGKVLSNDNVMIAGDVEGTKTPQTNYATSGGIRWYKGRTLTFTPAAGLTITKIRVRTHTGSQGKDFTYQIPAINGTDWVWDENITRLQSWTGQITEPTTVECSNGQNRCFYIEVTTEGTSTQVAKPVCSVTEPFVAAGQEVSFSCSTDGATIHYAVVTASEMLAAITTGQVDEKGNPIYQAYVENATYKDYTGPFTLTEDSYIRAYATKDGMTQSFPFYGDYYVVPAGMTVAKYSFSDWKSLVKTDGTSYTDADLTDLFLGGGTITDVDNAANQSISDAENGLAFISGSTKVQSGTNGQIFMSKTFGGVVEFRLSSAAAACFTVTSDYEISDIVFVGSYLTNLAVDDSGTGTYAVGGTNTSLARWTADAAAPTKSAVFKTVASANYIDQLYVFYKGAGAGPGAAIDEVGSDAIDYDAPVEYYNLQGMPVANPGSGLYIARQGKVVEKIIRK